MNDIGLSKEDIEQIDKIYAVRYIMEHINKLCPLVNCSIKKSSLSLNGNKIYVNLIIDWHLKEE